MQTCGERCMLLPSIYYSMMTDEDQVKKSSKELYFMELQGLFSHPYASMLLLALTVLQMFKWHMEICEKNKKANIFIEKVHTRKVQVAMYGSETH